MVDLKKIKAELEEFGWTVGINQNQRKDGTLKTPWLDAKMTLETTDFNVVNSSLEIIKEIVPAWEAIEAYRNHCRDEIDLIATYHPNEWEAEQPPSDAVNIVPCYVPCPQVSK